MTESAPTRKRRLVITVCSNEPGAVVLPVEQGERRRRLDGRAILRELQILVERRGLSAIVRVREGCAGGCHGRGPNVSLTMHAVPVPGRRADNVAVGWRTYVGSLDTLRCLAAVIEDNVASNRGRTPRTRRRSLPPRPQQRKWASARGVPIA